MPVTSRRARRATLVAGVLLGVLTGCGGGTEPAAEPPTPSGFPAMTAASTPSAEGAAAPSPSAPEPGSMEKPATTSGALTRTSFPAPARLGTGWRYAVDPGSAEEGYAGNGTPTVARRPEEVARTAVPLGCRRPERLPVPAHALETDYAMQGTPVVSVRVSFAGHAEAARFFAVRARTIEACAGRGSGAVGALVTAPTSPSSGVLVSVRTPRSDPWQELAVLDRDTVVLVAARGTDPLDPPTLRRLVRLLRS